MERDFSQIKINNSHFTHDFSTRYCWLYINLFVNLNLFLVVLVVLFIEIFEIYTIYKSIDHTMGNRLKVVIATSMVAGSLISLIYFNYVVLNVSPWFEPRYIIPIAGMMIGNA